MTAHIADELSELRRTVAELEQKLNASLSERDEALAQQSATADILKAISSANDLQTILTKAVFARFERGDSQTVSDDEVFVS